MTTINHKTGTREEWLSVRKAYSCYDRGTDVLNATWQLLDRAPRGRGGEPEDRPRRHDEYDA